MDYSSSSESLLTGQEAVQYDKHEGILCLCSDKRISCTALPNYLGMSWEMIFWTLVFPLEEHNVITLNRK